MSIISMTGVGESADKPRVLGVADGSDPIFVETTGLYEGVPKGQQVWVTGSKVQVGVSRGNLIPIAVDGMPMVTKVTRISATPAPTITEQVQGGTLTPPWSPESEPAPEPAAAEPPAPEPTPLPDDLDPDEPIRYNPADHSAADVIAYIEDHPDEAGAVLAAERAGKNRKTILREFD